MPRGRKMRNVDREILPKRSAGITTLIVIMFASALVLCESRSGVCAFMLRLEQPKSHRAEILGTNFPPTKQNTVPVKDANEQLRNTFDEPWIHENSGQGSGYQVKEGYSRYVVSKRRRQNVLKRRDRILKDIRDSISKRQALRRKKDSEDGDFEAVMDEKRSFIPNIFSFFRWRTSTKPGTLVLIRCGESVWNANKTFSGWADPDLSNIGRREMEHAARLLVESGYEIDVVFSSRLKRSIRSVWILLQELNQQYLPVFKSWRLNERMYGALTGKAKGKIAAVVGVDKVHEWRHSLNARPPPMGMSDPFWPGKERKFADIAPSMVPSAESLAESMERTRPIWETKILYELKMGRIVLVVAHGSSLRGLVRLISNVNDSEITEVPIPRGVPIVFHFDRQFLAPLRPADDDGKVIQAKINGMFLEKPGLLKDALKREEEWRMTVPSYGITMSRTRNPLSSLEYSLTKLVAERELEEWAADKADKIIRRDLIDAQSDDQSFIGTEAHMQEGLEPINWGTPCLAPIPSSPRSCLDSVVVMIRHGKTEHNKLGLFTGWEDAPLAPEGKEEARSAGKLLNMHGFKFDVVYSAWLCRAIETAWLVMDEMDCLWLPIIKSWRLNERMYGMLTGKSKRMIARQHGEAQLRSWRRGYKVRPPPVSSFCVEYPGNDVRYKNLHDIRFSFTESLMRTIDRGRFTLQRKFPKTESLHDCMKRAIPFYTRVIIPEAVDRGKRVLIASSENAIRGLLMHLCDIPEEKIVDLEIPNGLPIIYDLKSRCVKLLDDGSGIDPLERFNFGKAGEYLFKPCQNEDGTHDEECIISYSSSGESTER